MKKTSILHLLTPAKNASPFDVNMAFDSGFEKIMPYTEVTLSEVAGLTQDVIFSRSPSGVKQTGIFIGGRDIDVAMDMMAASKKSMFGPFTCSLFADPSGAFTTAGAMIAKVEFHLKKQFGEDLTDKKISVFGATGPVGGCVAIIAAKSGAKVQLIAHTEKSLEEAKVKIAGWAKAYEVELSVVLGASDAQKQAILNDTEIVLCAAAAGVQVISHAQILNAKHLKVLADVNAVAPMGIESVAVDSDGVLLKGTETFGIGAMAVGKLKYGTQLELLKKMLSEEKPQMLEFMAAFKLARELLAEANATTYAKEI
jgi:methylene-tetrahydromethanopterin dehydrogenase